MSDEAMRAKSRADQLAICTGAICFPCIGGNLDESGVLLSLLPARCGAEVWKPSRCFERVNQLPSLLFSVAG